MDREEITDKIERYERTISGLNLAVGYFFDDWFYADDSLRTCRDILEDEIVRLKKLLHVRVHEL